MNMAQTTSTAAKETTSTAMTATTAKRLAQAKGKDKAPTVAKRRVPKDGKEKSPTEAKSKIPTPPKKPMANAEQKEPLSGLMDVVVSKSDIVAALTHCDRVADRKSSLPVLSHVLLEARGNRLRVAATDVLIGLSTALPARTRTQGAVALPARDLLQRVKSLAEASVAFSMSDESTITMRGVGGDRSYTLSGLVAADFPRLPEPDAEAVVRVLDPQAMSALIKRTKCAISTDVSRVPMNGALLEWEGCRVRMVAVDGHRLCKMEVDGGKCAAGDARMLVPREGVIELGELCDRAEGVTKLVTSQSGPRAFFRLPNLILSVTLIDAQFPPYEQIIRERSQHVLRVSRKALIESLKAVQLAAGDRIGGVRLSVEDSAIHLESENPQCGSASDRLTVDYDGPPVAAKLSAKYLLEALSAMTTGDVCLCVTDVLDPALLWPSTTQPGGDYLAVVMPMRD